MCGICGKYSTSGISREELERMAAAIGHRGPDDEGYFVDGPIALASRRLSIIDTEGGHQPIANEDRTVCLVFNGEIYNFRALREELKRQGHRFSSRTDGEVIVHLYEEHGEACVDKLHGMFSFAIWDEPRRKLFLARDRLGQKPLFYAQTDTGMVFASEIKSILAGTEGDSGLDLESLHHYLSLRFVPSPRTMHKSIAKLPPAHCLVFQDGDLRTFRYWQLDFTRKLDLSEEDILAALREELERAVTSHLVSDVPVGALLSGGMDSSVIVAMMAAVSSGPVMTFAIGAEEESFNELPYARVVAQRYCTRHFEGRVESRLISRLPEMINHLDEPSDPVAACMYHAAELAARHVKVVLGGDGGDELFAGFDRYIGMGYLESYRRLPPLVRRFLLQPILRSITEDFSYKSLSQKLRWIDRVSAASDPAARYAGATIFFRFSQAQKQELFTEPLWHDLRDLDSTQPIVEQYNSPFAKDPIDRMLYADFMTRLPEHSLMLTDRMSMAHSVEVRCPYLDHQLVEFLARTPSDLKIRRRTLKYALRQVSSDLLPKEILDRDKQGFMFPMAYWFQHELYQPLRSLLLDSATVRDGLFERSTIEKLIEDHRLQRTDHHVRIWMLLNFELWYRMYVDGHDLDQTTERVVDSLAALERRAS
jgi:asparagine synthase (glutamine-hydrolysing)